MSVKTKSYYRAYETINSTKILKVPVSFAFVPNGDMTKKIVVRDVEKAKVALLAISKFCNVRNYDIQTKNKAVGNNQEVLINFSLNSEVKKPLIDETGAEKLVYLLKELLPMAERDARETLKLGFDQQTVDHHNRTVEETKGLLSLLQNEEQESHKEESGYLYNIV